MQRREFVKTSFITALGTPLLGCQGGVQDDAEVRDAVPPEDVSSIFRHGVASGDPTPSGVVIWTRITTDAPEAKTAIPVRFVVAKDPGLEDIILAGETRTDAGRDFTVKVDLDGQLEPETTYYYGFVALGEGSPIGRTRTFPAVGGQQLRIAAMTCASTPRADEEDGTYATYHLLAQREDIDLVMHLGDYVYSDQVTLEQYRRSYEVKRRDPSLQRAHQQFAWVVMWDDHEIANEPWATDAEFHDEERDGSWEVRKNLGTQAFWEWLPMRQPREVNSHGWRRLQVGDLMDILILDARLHRSRWISEERETPFFTLFLNEIDDPERTKLGALQEAWLSEQLDSSTATWRMLTTGVPMIPWKLPGLPHIPPEALRRLGLQQIPLPVTQGGNNPTLDKWDGYPAARRRLLLELEEKGLNNNLILSGDLHFVLSGDIPLDPFDLSTYDPVTGRGSRAFEMVAPPVSSSGFDEALQGTVPDQLRSEMIQTLELGNTAVNPHQVYTEFKSKGILLLDITPERIRGEFHFLTGPRARLDNSFSMAMALECARDGQDALAPLTQPNKLRIAIDQASSSMLRPTDAPAPDPNQRVAPGV